MPCSPRPTVARSVRDEGYYITPGDAASEVVTVDMLQNKWNMYSKDERVGINLSTSFLA